MKTKKIFVIIFLIIILVASVVCAVIVVINNKPDYGNLSAAIATIGLLITAVYGFRSNREAIRLQTSMQFSTDVYKKLHSELFKRTERNIQIKLSSLRAKGIICAIEDLEDEDLKQDIKRYCGYMDGIGILVTEHLIKPEVILYNAGVGLLRTFFLLKPYLDKSRKKRRENASHDISDKNVDYVICNAVELHYANMELLALEMRRRGPLLIKEFKKKLKQANKNKKVIRG